MRRTLFFLVLSLATCLTGAQTSESCFISISEGGTTSSAMSPNGKYAVGQKASSFGMGEEAMYTSYLWNAEDGRLTWMTEYDENDFRKSGFFTDVNDEKTIVGYFKDENYTLTYTDLGEVFSGPVCVATVWKDGKTTSLGIGDFTLNDFSSFSDGSFAMAVSADSKTIAGYINQGNGTTFTPCCWTYNDETHKWDFTRYAVPQGSQGGQIGSISADGQIAVGYVAYHLRAIPAIWTSPTECTMITFTEEDAKYNEEFSFNYGYKISPNGHYVLFTLNNMIPCIYSIKEQKYIKLNAYTDAGGLSVHAISNQGDVVGAFTYGNFFEGTYTRPFWYSYHDNKLTDFEYLIQSYAPEVEIPFSFKFSDKITSNPQSISADGTTVFGTNSEGSWILHTQAERILLPEYITNVKAVNSKLKEVTISWDKVVTIPSGLTLKSYNIYCNDELLTKIDVTSLPADATRGQYVQKNIVPGTYSYSIAGEYTSENGKTYESPKTIAIAVSVVESFALPLFDDFASGNFDTNAWVNDLLWGNAGDDLKWQCRTSGDDNQTISATNIVVTDKPYSASLTSRYMDATGLNNVYVSFFKRLQYANRDDWDLTVDSLSLELSTDDENWLKVKDYPADKVVAGYWNFEQIDITTLAAHKQFKLRFRTHGKALAQLIWYVDIFKVGNEAEKEIAPEGLTGIVENGKVNLIWKNSLNAYELSYLENSNALYELTLGDDQGAPVIVASAFDPVQLKLYDGKYITSVTTFLFDIPELETEASHASILIYENNQLIHEQEIKNIVNGETFTVKLDKAVKVDASKELKVAMKIFNYDPQQTPIYYQCTDQYVPGKSDLYSEDDGKTWKKLSEYYSNTAGKEDWGFACWPMRANITDEATIEDNPVLNTNLVGYNIYRNGEQINDGIIYSSYMKFTDDQPMDNACYDVVAFYLDGGVSNYSEQYCVESIPDGIKEKGDETIVSVFPNPATDYICISGTFDSATLLNINGQAVVSTRKTTLSLSGLPAGVYILRVESDDHVYTEKIMIER